MTVRYVDDGGSNTSPYDTWAKAATAFATALTASTADDIIYVGHDHAETLTAANTTYTGGNNGYNNHIRVISATTGSSPPTYAKATSAQFGTSSASDYSITWNQSFYLKGIFVTAGGLHTLNTDTNQDLLAEDCTFVCATGDTDGYLTISREGHTKVKQCTFTNNRTGTDTRAHTYIASRGTAHIDDCTFNTDVAVTRFTGPVFFHFSSSFAVITGGDCSSLTSCTSILDDNNTGAYARADGMKPPSGVALHDAGESSPVPWGDYTRGAADTFATGRDYVHGNVVESETYTRTGGATDGTPFSWVITTETDCNYATPVETPWTKVWVNSTGSATVDMYITSTDALTDTECWMEVMYQDTASSAATVMASTRNADPLAAGTTLTTGGTWSDTGLIEYQLSQAITIGTAGYVMARIVMGVDLTATLDTRTGECYVCPELEVS